MIHADEVTAPPTAACSVNEADVVGMDRLTGVTAQLCANVHRSVWTTRTGLNSQVLCYYNVNIEADLPEQLLE